VQVADFNRRGPGRPGRGSGLRDAAKEAPGGSKNETVYEPRRRKQTRKFVFEGVENLMARQATREDAIPELTKTIKEEAKARQEQQELNIQMMRSMLGVLQQMQAHQANRPL
jgi:hypothetical protein